MKEYYIGFLSTALFCGLQATSLFLFIVDGLGKIAIAANITTLVITAALMVHQGLMSLIVFATDGWQRRSA